MKPFLKTTIAIALCEALAQIATQGAWAQTSPDKAPSSDEDKPNQVIVVTAQRRSEELQKVPLSITTLSAKDLEDKQIRRLDDMKFEVPNVIIEQNTATSSGARVHMRGVGTDESLFTADPSVAIYIDDMYVARQTGAMFDMFDLQRVEVLRGPQGTLYGRNATGGAIRYITKPPSGQSRLEIDSRLGNLGRVDVGLNGSGMLGGKIAVSYGLMSKSRNGYLHDITNNRDVNDEKIDGARASFATNVTESTNVRLSIDTLRQRSGPTYASGVVDATAAAQYKRPLNNADGDLRTIETNLVNGNNSLDQTGLSLSTSTDMGSFEWRNILTYRSMDNLLYVDMDGTKGTNFHLYQDQSQNQSSYETQLVSSTKGPLSWTTGLFVLTEKNDQPTRQDIFATGGVNTIRQKTVASALYGQADWRFNTVWKATGGLRFSNESKDFSIASLKANGTPNFDFQRKNTWTRTDWKLGLDAQLDTNLLAYGSATTGFKSGGFDGRAGTLAAAQTTVLRPETVLTYEVGFKSTLANGAWRLNANYFRNDYQDLQITAFDQQGKSVLLNAANALIDGVEVESTFQFTKRWQASLNIGTLSARYKDYSAANVAVFDGKQLKQAPKLQYGLSTSYRMPVSGGDLVLNGQLKYVGDHQQNLANSPLILTKAYTLVDARMAYEASGGKWAVGLWGKNLTDKTYYTGGFDIAGIGLAAAYINVPRTVGVDLRYRFW